MPVAELPATILNDAELLDLARRVSAAIEASHAEHSWFGPIAEDIGGADSSDKLGPQPSSRQ